jgi:hypothetical protein
MTMSNRISLRPGRVVNHRLGRFAVAYLEPADQPVVELVIHTGEREERRSARPGERFLLDGGSWLVERVENVGGRDWEVVLRQAD